MGTLLLYGIWPRNPLIISSTCSAFRGYFSETSHALYQAPVPSTERKCDVRAHHFPRIFWAGNWPITSVVTRGKWWRRCLSQNHGSDNRTGSTLRNTLPLFHILSHLRSWDRTEIRLTWLICESRVDGFVWNRMKRLGEGGLLINGAVVTGVVTWMCRVNCGRYTMTASVIDARIRSN